ncbi:hypothetical protein [Azospirillum argentinense]
MLPIWTVPVRRASANNREGAEGSRAGVGFAISLPCAPHRPANRKVPPRPAAPESVAARAVSRRCGGSRADTAFQAPP